MSKIPLSFVTRASDNSPRAASASVSELARWCASRAPELTTKDGPAVIGATFRAAPHASTGQMGTWRQASSVATVWWLILDVDSGADVEPLLRLWPVEGLAYSSWSHQVPKPATQRKTAEAAVPRYRVMMPLARAITVDEHRVLWRWADQRCGAGVIDASCKDPCRLYYLPRAKNPAAAAAPWIRQMGGPRLDPDDLPGGQTIAGLLTLDIAERAAQATRAAVADAYEPLSLDEEARRIAGALQHVDADDRDTWIQVGMGLQSWDPARGRVAWMRWSATSPKFDEDDAERVWASLGRRDGVTVGTVYHLAQAGGWSPPVRARQVSVPPAAGLNGAGDEPPHPAEEHVDAKQRALTDLGNVERLLATDGQDLLYWPQRGTWLIWDGHRWQVDGGGRILRQTCLMARRIQREAAGLPADSDAAKQIAKWAKRSEQTRVQLDCLRLAQAFQPVLADELDANPWLLGTGSGTVDLRTGKLQSPRRSDRGTKWTPVEYDPGAQCPTWTAFLGRVLAGQPELVEYVQRAVGYTLTGDVSMQCLFLLHGGGANGKSTLIETVRSLLGDYAHGLAFSSLLADQRGARGGDTPRPDIAGLRGARYVTAVEAEDGRCLDEELVKQITGGDAVTARFLHRNPFTFRPTHKLWLAANHLPTVRGMDDAIWRRIKRIPFEVTIPVDERDPDLPSKLGQELPGILAWAVRGCLAWLREGRLLEPAQVAQATGAYRDEQDKVGRFLADCCVRHPEACVTKAALYGEWARWCKDGGELPWSKRRLGAELARRGVEERRTSAQRTWWGIGLRTEYEDLVGKGGNGGGGWGTTEQLW